MNIFKFNFKVEYGMVNKFINLCMYVVFKNLRVEKFKTS